MLGQARWQILIAAVAAGAAVAAVWVTLDADFLRYPGWLAAQKADFILGPVFVGLYWVHRRPRSRFGPLLIALGFVGAVYVLQSAANSWLFGIGVVWENVVYLATEALILTFPTGRLDGLAAKLIVAVACVGVVVPATLIELVLPQVGAGASISGCRTLCPENALAVTSDPSLALTLTDIYRPVGIAVSAATAVLLVWRLVRGTPPRRRALRIGTPVALLFLVLQVAYQLLAYAPTSAATLHAVIRWGIVGSRALIWYGFLGALIAAELFASRALRELVAMSLRRPRQPELETMLRAPLGDPTLRVAFLDPAAAAWLHAEHRPPRPAPGQTMTVIDGGDGRPKVALLHDAQLDDDPELVQAAGEVALLAAENAQLDAAWNAALDELRRSRARIVRAADAERRKLERDLHDGVQQRLTASMIELGLIAEREPPASEIRECLTRALDGLEQALDELRDVSHGLYPPVLSISGLPGALENLRLSGNAQLVCDAAGVGRHSLELESAVYYCCSEAVLNATKHTAGATSISVTVREDADALRFEISDDGAGFDVSASHDGSGLQNMHDRVGALDGRLSVVSTPGEGTVIRGRIPLAGDRAAGRAGDVVPRA